MSHLQKEALAVAKLKEEIAAAGHDDPELIACMIEGETSYVETMASLLDQFGEVEALCSAISTRQDALQARKARLAARGQTLRRLMFDGLNLAGESKLVLPEGTLSIAAGAPSVIVANEAELPEEFVVVKRSVDKVALGKALKAGRPVSGAYLSNGSARLSIRRA